MNTPITIPAGALLEPYIGKAEVAKRLNKGLRTVDNYMRKGIIPYYKMGHSVQFKWSEVEKHLSETCRVCRKLPPGQKLP